MSKFHDWLLEKITGRLNEPDPKPAPVEKPAFKGFGNREIEKANPVLEALAEKIRMRCSCGSVMTYTGSKPDNIGSIYRWYGHSCPDCGVEVELVPLEVKGDGSVNGGCFEFHPDAPTSCRFFDTDEPFDRARATVLPIIE